MYKKICEEVSKIVSPIYLVGGAVRDILLNKEPKDYDFTTPLTPDEIENAIRKAERHPYLIGKRFGTVGVKIDGVLVEITTFRSEKYEEGNRKPAVEFVKDISADLSRRDFTINAIAMRIDDNYRMIDLFDGKLDLLERKVIRCVGNARDRFKEDPLRMLRACRFASQLEYPIYPDTLDKMCEMSHKILEVSKERWVLELDKLLTVDKPNFGLEYLIASCLMNFMIPELSLQLNYKQNSPHHQYDLWTHTKLVVDNIQNDIMLRWAALLHDIAKPFVRTERPDRSNYIKHDLLGRELVIRLAYYLKWSNERREIVSDLVLNHLKDESPLKDADKKSKIAR